MNFFDFSGLGFLRALPSAASSGIALSTVGEFLRALPSAASSGIALSTVGGIPSGIALSTVGDSFGLYLE